MVLAQVLIDRFLRSKQLEQQYDLNSYEKLVLFFLASYTGSNPSCNPSIKTLAKNCSVSSDTIKRCLKSIEKKELIKIQRISGNSNHYFFTLPEISQPSATSTGCSQRLDADSTPPLVPTAPRGSAHSTPNNINNNISEYTSLQESEECASSAKSSNSNHSACTQLFEYWKTVMNYPSAKLDSKRKRVIEQALKLGFSLEDLMLAIDGCKNSPFHMGQNEHKKKYDDISLILRDAAHIERFMNEHDDISESSNWMAGVE